MPSDDKPVVLVLAPFYLPGFKGGGPIRSIANMVDALHEHFRFRIITMDRDLGDANRYAEVAVDEWNCVGRARVYYSSPKTLSFGGLVRLLRTVDHDVVYLNSFFDPTLTLPVVLARWLGLVPKRPLVVAPRGEFSSGALRLRRWKKAPFAWLMKRLTVYRTATWHASTELEAEDVKRIMGQAANVCIAQNCTALGESKAAYRSGDGDLRVCFLSRISPKKNLAYALDVLSKVTCPLQFNIFGPSEDKVYWQACLDRIEALPDHIKVKYCGPVSQSDVQGALAQHDLLFVPTRGENFGHVFAESFAAGVPVLVSDQTPWRELRSRGVGWDLPLESPHSFVEAIEEASAWTNERREEISGLCRAFAHTRLDSARVTEQNRSLFQTALASSN